MRILVAEDERDLNEILCKKLRSEDYCVDGCFDGEEALDYLASVEYDAVILDIMMPKRSGLQVVEQLRRQGDHTPVLFLTARDSIDDRVTGLDAGADDYLVKPFAFDELLARLRVMTRKRGGERSNLFTIDDLTLDIRSKRVERGQTQLAREETDLTELVEVICEDQQELLPEHLTLRWELEPVTAEVHQDMMIRLVINLLNNAVRYAKSEILVTLTCHHDTVTLTVADDGVGIEPEHQKRIFQRFYQVDGARARKSGGLGLGLAMCDQIIRQHGGRISVESTPGEGSRFFVTFPARQEEET